MSRMLLTLVCLALLPLPTRGQSAPKPVGNQKVDDTPPSSCPVTIGRKSSIAGFSAFRAPIGMAIYMWALSWPDGTIVFRPGERGLYIQMVPWA